MEKRFIENRDFSKPIALLLDEYFTEMKRRKRWQKDFSWRRKNSLNGPWRQLLYLDTYFHEKRLIENRNSSKPIALLFDENLNKIKRRKNGRKSFLGAGKTV